MLPNVPQSALTAWRCAGSHTDVQTYRACHLLLKLLDARQPAIASKHQYNAEGLILQAVSTVIDVSGVIISNDKQ